jgi:hypothetical protein
MSWVRQWMGWRLHKGGRHWHMPFWSSSGLAYCMCLLWGAHIACAKADCGLQDVCSSYVYVVLVFSRILYPLRVKARRTVPLRTSHIIHTLPSAIGPLTIHSMMTRLTPLGYTSPIKLPKALLLLIYRMAVTCSRPLSIDVNIKALSESAAGHIIFSPAMIRVLEGLGASKMI